MSETTTPRPHTDSGRISEAAKKAANRVAHSAAEMTHDCAQHYVSEPAKDLLGLAKEYGATSQMSQLCGALVWDSWSAGNSSRSVLS